MKSNHTLEELTLDTKEHIEDVNNLGKLFTKKLSDQLQMHDHDKLIPENLMVLKQSLNKEIGWEKWTEIHNKNSAHHIEYHPDIHNIPLYNLVEMVIDGAAACYRRKKGYTPVIDDQIKIYKRLGFGHEVALLLANEFMRQYNNLKQLNNEKED